MALNPKVQTRRDSNVRHSDSVSLSWYCHRENEIPLKKQNQTKTLWSRTELVITHQDGLWLFRNRFHREQEFDCIGKVLFRWWERHQAFQDLYHHLKPSSKPNIFQNLIKCSCHCLNWRWEKCRKTTNRVVSCVPITNGDGNVTFWSRERDWDNGSRVHNEGAKATRSSLEMKRWEVEETSDLVFHLKLISPIPLWWDWTVCSCKSILPRNTSLLDSRPVRKTKHRVYKGVLRLKEETFVILLLPVKKKSLV